MTKRDYALIAGAIATVNRGRVGDMGFAPEQDRALLVAHYLESVFLTNDPNFDKAKFWEMCTS